MAASTAQWKLVVGHHPVRRQLLLLGSRSHLQLLVVKWNVSSRHMRQVHRCWEIAVHLFTCVRRSQHQVYSSGGAHGDTAELQQYIEPLLHKYKVQV